MGGVRRPDCAGEPVMGGDCKALGFGLGQGGVCGDDADCRIGSVLRAPAALHLAELYAQVGCGIAEFCRQAKAADSVDDQGRLLAADGTPLKRSLARSLRVQKIRALALIAPLLLFVLVTFIAPIADMLFRSVENEIVPETLPRTVQLIGDWDHNSGEAPDAELFEAFYYDMAIAAQLKNHTRLGTRLNYEQTGISSLFRQSGRDIEDIGDVYVDQFEDLDEAWEEPATWLALMGDADWRDSYM